MQRKTEENALVMEEKLTRAETQCKFLTKQNDGLKAIIQSDDENNQQFSNEDEKNMRVSIKKRRRGSDGPQKQHTRQMIPIRTILLVLNLASN